MKSTIYILLTFFLSFLLLGCSDVTPESGVKKPVVFASILPLSGIAKSIAGSEIDIVTLVGEGQSPHTFEPTARQLVLLGEADVFLAIGVPFEIQLLKKIEPIYTELKIVQTQTGISHRSFEHAHHDHGEGCTHGEGELDPHVWMSPLNVISIAEACCAAFQEIDPEHADLYQANLEKLTAEYTQLDKYIHSLLDSYAGGKFYVFHPAFGYFADAYGLEQVAIEYEGKSLPPQRLARLITQAEQEGIKTIFVQKQFPKENAKALAQAIQGSVEYLDSLAEDNATNLRLMADRIAAALVTSKGCVHE